jgi:hypothetical protein
MHKLKLEFEGWHCLPKKETKTILSIARAQFRNANFVDNNGLLVETDNELDAFRFCLYVISTYQKLFGSWDGYIVRKVSRRIIFNYQDKKRKLSFEYFKKLVIENKFDDIKIVLAGILYLDPDEVKVALSTIERDIVKLFSEMNDEELKIAYNTLVKFASISIRKFSLSVKTERDEDHDTQNNASDMAG